MKHYSMVFYTTTGSRRSVRVNNPNTDLPLPQIAGAVEQLIDNCVYDPQAGGLESLSRMELTVVERSVIL